MCRANMAKNAFVLQNMDRILDCLTRGLDLDILTRGHGVESGASWSVTRPSRPCWAPCCPRTRPACTRSGCPSFRCSSAWCSSRDPRNLDALSDLGRLRRGGHSGRGVRPLSGWTRRGRGDPLHLPASHDLRRGGDGRAVQGNPRVQVHGPGFSKILLGDDVVDEWEQHWT